MADRLTTPGSPAIPANAAVLISGGGSNLQAIMDAACESDFAAQIAVVISNSPRAKGLQRARDAGIPTACIRHDEFPTRLAFDQALIAAIDAYAPEIIILAGFMRILTAEFITHYRGRILNIHPSLLPAYTGLNTHQRVIDNKDPWHGCTVHFVTEELDGGPLLIQGRVAVRDDDTAESLATRVLRVEHEIYPIAVGLFGSGRARCENGVVTLDGQPLMHPIAYPAEPDALQET